MLQSIVRISQEVDLWGSDCDLGAPVVARAPMGRGWFVVFERKWAIQREDIGKECRKLQLIWRSFAGNIHIVDIRRSGKFLDKEITVLNVPHQGRQIVTQSNTS